MTDTQGEQNRTWLAKTCPPKKENQKIENVHIDAAKAT